MRKFILFILSISLFSCGEGSSTIHNWRENRGERAQTMLFFSGMYSVDDSSNATFYDCVTGRTCDINSNSLVAQKIAIAYNKLGYKNSQQIYTTLRGYIDQSGVLDVNEFLGFSDGLTCENNPKMSMIYISNGDTLSLYDDYSYHLKVASKGDSRGVWGRNYNDQGFLLRDSLYSVQFIINFEPENTPNAPTLIFKRLDGDKEILLPINK